MYVYTYIYLSKIQIPWSFITWHSSSHLSSWIFNLCSLTSYNHIKRSGSAPCVNICPLKCTFFMTLRMTEPDLIRSDSDLDIPVFRYPFYYLQNKIKITKVCSPMRCNTRANATRPKRAPAVSRIVKVSYVIRSAFIFFFSFCFKDLENPSDLTILIESLLTSLNMSISR